MKNLSFSDLRGDIYGGVSTGLVTLLECIPFGLIAFAPLGIEYVNLGITAAIYAAIFAGLVAAIFGGTPGLITVPNPASSLMFSFVIIGLQNSKFLRLSGDTSEILTLAFLTLFLAGLLQLLMGVLRSDYLIKFISYPVIAGIVSGIGILMIISQFEHLTGIHNVESIFDHLHEVKGWNLFVGLFTAALFWNKERILGGALGFLLVIALGMGCYYTLLILGVDRGSLGDVIGPVPFEFPLPDQLFAGTALFQKYELPDLLAYLLPPALSLAFLCATITLLSTLALKSMTHQKGDTRKELIGQGLGNICSACFGGLPSLGGLSRSAFNYHEGGRTNLSGVICALTVLSLALFFSPVIQYIPTSLIAGLLVVLGVKLIDKWTLNLIKNLVKGKIKLSKEIAFNLGIVFVVVFVIVSGHLIPAVGIGVLISILLYLSKMRTVLIKRIYEDQSIPSKKMQNLKAMEFLNERIHDVKVVELAGIIYFGSAERLAAQVEQLADEGAEYIILDMKGVNEIDLTGARLLEMTYLTLQKKGRKLGFSSIEEGGAVWLFLKNMSFFEKIDSSCIFVDTDHGLQYFENLMLEKSGRKVDDVELKLSKLLVFENLTQEEMETVKQYLVKETFSQGEAIVSEGEDADAMFFLTKGSVDVFIHVGKGSTLHEKRVQTLTSGAFFGEMALFQQKARSATIIASSDVILFRLSYDKFQSFVRGHSHLSNVLLGNMCRILSKRLSFINKVISSMEA